MQRSCFPTCCYHFAIDKAILDVLEHTSPKLSEIVREAPFMGNIDLSFKSNALLEAAVRNGCGKLALKLFTDLLVFKMASEAILKVFPVSRFSLRHPQLPQRTTNSLVVIDRHKCR